MLLASTLSVDSANGLRAIVGLAKLSTSTFLSFVQHTVIVNVSPVVIAEAVHDMNGNYVCQDIPQRASTTCNILYSRHDSGCVSLG